MQLCKRYIVIRMLYCNSASQTFFISIRIALLFYVNYIQCHVNFSLITNGKCCTGKLQHVRYSIFCLLRRPQSQILGILFTNSYIRIFDIFDEKITIFLIRDK